MSTSSTTKSQRIFIWVIAITMLVGTLGGFAAMIMTTQESIKTQEKIGKYRQEVKENNEKIREHFDEFAKYKSHVAKFEAKDVTKLSTKDLKVGSGDEIKGDTNFLAYYIGFNAKGEIFDESTVDGDPFLINKLDETGIIEGWKEGLKGMKIGGVREITIPSDKAYGERAVGDKIPANSPLKFIIMTFKAVDPPKL